MPPQHAQGDVLDRALAVARSQAPAHVAANPALNPAQKGFFGAVAGARSPLNRQSSRIAQPFADNPFLGGGNKGSVATPAQQALLARSNANDKTAPAPIRRQATTIAQNYVKGADTEKVIPAHRTAAAPRGGGAGIQGAALTAPNAIAQGQRALGLIGASIPLGSAAPAALRGIEALGLPNVERQQVIQGFAHDTSTDQPVVQASLIAQALAKGHSIPAHPTEAQLLTAALAPNEHKPSWGDAINPFNIAKDALYTPLYTVEGGYALGHASREALPTALGGKGDTSGLKAIGESQLQQLEHPGATIEAHPAQTLLALSGIAKGVGKLGGLAAGAEATPRLVTPTAFEGVPALDRGTYSTNLTDRLGQKVSDRMLGNSERLQSKAILRRGRQIHAAAKNEQAAAFEANTKPLVEAAKNISPREQASLLYNEGQGGTADEFAQMYEDKAVASKAAGKRLAPKTQAAQARLRAAQAEAFGTEMTPERQAFLDAARGGSQGRTEMLKGMQTPAGTPALNPVSAQWRDLQHFVGLRASQGDELAQAVQKARKAATSLPKGSPEIPAAQAALQQRLDAFARANPDSQPFRVPTRRPALASDYNFPGKSVRARTEIKSMVSGLGGKKSFNSGGAFESGNFPHDTSEFYRQLRQPHTAAASIDFVNRVSKELSAPAIPGEPIPDNMVLRSTKNLRATPKVAVNAADHLDADTAALQSMHEEFIDPHVNDLTHVPAGFKGVLLPRPLYDEITKQVAHAKPGGLAKATQIYKNTAVYSKPSLVTSRALQNGIQAGIGGTGPLSWLRRNDIPLPPGVRENGYSTELGAIGRRGLRSGIAEAKIATNPVDKTWAIAKGLGREFDKQTMSRIKQGAIANDNAARAATYGKFALPEARKLAYPEDSALKRIVVRRRALDPKIQDVLKQMANGDTEAARQAAGRALKPMNDLLGDWAAMPRRPLIDVAVPFNKWTIFSAKLLLRTLPLNYPGRTLLIYRIGQLGQQASGQQGILPPYLQNLIPLGPNSPTHQLIAETERADPLTTMGSIFSQQPTTGNFLDTSNLVGQTSPFAPLVLNTLTGHDIETGSPIENAQGKPITDSLGDQARYLGAQAASWFPPLGAAMGGTRNKAPTSIPLPFLEQNKKAPAKPGTGQPNQPGWLPFFNLLSPVHLDVRNLTADQAKGAANLQTYLNQQQDAENTREAGKPGGTAKVLAKWQKTKWQKIGAAINTNLTYYVAHPEAVQKILATGHP